MFGRKKMYKKGLADAMRAYEDFGKKQEAALEHMREEVRNGNKKLEDALAGLGEDLNGIYDYLNSKEKEALYHLSTPMDVKELEEKEQRLLLAVLYQLAEDEGDALTDSQRAYIRSVQRYMGITNPQTFADFSAIENIDSIDVQKTFLRVALEFFYLQDSDELSDAQEEFFDYFSVNKKQATVIENEVSRLFNAVGAEGLAEKYGYVPLEEPEQTNDVYAKGEEEVGLKSDMPDANSITEDLADEIAKMKFFDAVVETENYILLSHGSGEFFRIDKRNHEWTYVKEKKDSKQPFPRLDCIHWGDKNFHKVLTYKDTAYYQSYYGGQDALYAFHADTLETPEKVISGHYINASIFGDFMVLKSADSLFLLDLKAQKCKAIVNGYDFQYGGRGVLCTQDGVYFSCVDDSGTFGFIKYYDFTTKEISTVKKSVYARNIDEILFVCDDYIFIKQSNTYCEISLTIDDESIGYDPTKITKPLDVMVWTNNEYFVNSRVCNYPDLLIYVAKDHSLKATVYSVDNTKTIGQNAIPKDDNRRIGLPGGFYRIGKWIYWETDYKFDAGAMVAGTDYKTYYKVSLDAPGEVEMLDTHDTNTCKRLVAEMKQKIMGAV